MGGSRIGILDDRRRCRYIASVILAWGMLKGGSVYYMRVWCVLMRG